VFVLDDENEKDHEFGAFLTKDFNFTVLYEGLPENGTLEIRPFKSAGGHYATEGYSRQLYSTFFFDKYTDADVIGVIDVDNIFFTVLTESNILNDINQIYLPAVVGDHYEGDSIALNTTIPFDFMFTDVMPKWFYRKTFTELRMFLETVDNGPFNVSWKRFGSYWMAPVNILSYYGLMHQPDLYALILPTDSVGYIPVALNRPPNLPGVNVRFFGCCRLYGLYCNNMIDFIYFNNALYDLVWKKENPIWFKTGAHLLSKHKSVVDDYLSRNLDFKEKSMKACEKHIPKINL